MLGIYQEYVRNHHYSLQVLAEYKQKPDFNQLLHRYEEKSICEGRSFATFLTYPMHQVRSPIGWKFYADKSYHIISFVKAPLIRSIGAPQYTTSTKQ